MKPYSMIGAATVAAMTAFAASKVGVVAECSTKPISWVAVLIILAFTSAMIFCGYMMRMEHEDD